MLEIATTLGALTGVLLVGAVSASILYFLFAVILIVSAQQMLARRGEPVDPAAAVEPGQFVSRLRLESSYPDRTLGCDVPYHVQRLPAGMLLMYGAGLISALLGIGSGVLKIPAMDTALRLPIKVSTATSNFMIGVTAGRRAQLRYFLRDDIARLRSPGLWPWVPSSVRSLARAFSWQCRMTRFAYCSS